MNEYAKALGGRLRAIRIQQGLSLQGVEQRSGGRWKAVVIGSYERGDRAVTVARLSQLAEFYRVPVAELLPAATGRGSGPPATGVVVDLERLRQVPAEQEAPLLRYTAGIQRQRGDYNGQVLSLRQDDVRSLAALYDISPEAVADRLAGAGVLRSSASPG